MDIQRVIQYLSEADCYVHNDIFWPWYNKAIDELHRLSDYITKEEKETDIPY